MNICGFCGAETDSNETICPICGFELQIAQGVPMQTGEERNAKRKTIPRNVSSSNSRNRKSPTIITDSTQNMAVRFVIPLIAFAVCFISIALSSAALYLW